MDADSRRDAIQLFFQNRGFRFHRGAGADYTAAHFKYLMLCAGLSPGGNANPVTDEYCCRVFKLAENKSLPPDAFTMDKRGLAGLVATELSYQEMQPELCRLPLTHRLVMDASDQITKQYMRAWSIYVELRAGETSGIIRDPFEP